ncbi:MAG: DUF11 domain-containing protein [Chloroflexota bacterium]|nr:DUF11 domain-containing protein [Chloroflexota bacterium]
MHLLPRKLVVLISSGVLLIIASFAPQVASVGAAQGEGADLAVTKTASPIPVDTDETLTYTIVVTNNGPSNAQNVVLRDPLPSGITVPPTGIETTQGTCTRTPTPIATVVQCQLGELGTDDTATVTISGTVTAATGETITNAVQVSSDTDDPNPANNAATVQLTVGEEPVQTDLAITKEADAEQVNVGDAIEYTVTVTNNGPDDATGVTVVDGPLPAGVAITDADITPGQGTCDPIAQPVPGGPRSVTCNLGNLANGDSTTITIEGVVLPTATSPITNNVLVRGAEQDPNPANNTATVTTEVGEPTAVTVDAISVNTGSGYGFAVLALAGSVGLAGLVLIRRRR